MRSRRRPRSAAAAFKTVRVEEGAPRDRGGSACCAGTRGRQPLHPNTSPCSTSARQGCSRLRVRPGHRCARRGGRRCRRGAGDVRQAAARSTTRTARASFTATSPSNLMLTEDLAGSRRPASPSCSTRPPTDITGLWSAAHLSPEQSAATSSTPDRRLRSACSSEILCRGEAVRSRHADHAVYRIINQEPTSIVVHRPDLGRARRLVRRMLAMARSVHLPRGRARGRDRRLRAGLSRRCSPGAADSRRAMPPCGCPRTRCRRFPPPPGVPPPPPIAAPPPSPPLPPLPRCRRCGRTVHRPAFAPGGAEVVCSGRRRGGRAARLARRRRLGASLSLRGAVK
jgi:hypothetical protein